MRRVESAFERPMLWQGCRNGPTPAPMTDIRRRSLRRTPRDGIRSRGNEATPRGWYGETMTLTGLAIFLILGVAAFVLVNKLKDH